MKKDQLCVIQIVFITQQSTCECSISLIYRGKNYRVTCSLDENLNFLIIYCNTFLSWFLRILRHLLATKSLCDYLYIFHFCCSELSNSMFVKFNHTFIKGERDTLAEKINSWVVFVCNKLWSCLVDCWWEVYRSSNLYFVDWSPWNNVKPGTYKPRIFFFLLTLYLYTQVQIRLGHSH